jgi:hypothetical protein
MDKYIPLEICRLNELVPLRFHEGCLTIGIVDLSQLTINPVVLKLQKRKHLRLKGQKLDNKTFQLILSSYLGYHQTTDKMPTTSGSKTSKPGSPQQEFTEVVPSIATEKATFVIDQDVTPPFIMPRQAESDSNTILSGNALPLSAQAEEPGGDVQSILVPNAPVSINRPLHTPPPANPPVHSRLNLHPLHMNEPLGNLAKLPPQQLWHELLGRVLSEGIGRLYFENHVNEGRILLSESGVMKGALYEIPMKTFYGVLNEFKRLAHIPPTPVTATKKAEMEQYYRDERLLLRLTIIPGRHGEEGTLQVLRGQALVFHQQKQMDEQGSEALQIAQQLERKLRHIYLRSQINPSPVTALPELIAICDRMRAQVDNIRRPD